MEKELWKLVIYEIPSSWQEIIQHGEEPPWAAPRNFPLCVRAWNKKSWPRGAEGKQFSQPEHHMDTPRDR